jgi:outer membrane protein OmpA-like peptidoglycan-associated protein
MTLDLLAILRTAFGDAIVHRAATHLGEPAAKIHAGLDAALPLTLAGLLHRVDAGDAEQVIALAKDAMRRNHVMDLAGQFSDGHGGVPAGAPALITGLFGSRFGAIANAVTARTELKGASTSALFGAAVPYALAELGRMVEAQHVTPGGLAAFLAPLRGIVQRAMPAGYDVATLFGARPAARAAVAPAPASSGSKWLLPAVAAAALAALFWFIGRTRAPETPAAPAVVRVDTVERTVTDTLRVAVEPKKLTLRDGTVLDATAGGIEELLIAFVDDSAAKPGNDNWFDFSELTFEFGTARITAGSQREIDNIVKILKAYPALRIKLGGYTDRVGGDANANRTLSLARAEAVAAALREAGVGGQVVGAEGYGAEFAKFPASAPEIDRATDRRIAVSVRAK